MIRIACRTLLAAAVLCSFGMLWAQQDSQSPTAPDNTKMNQRDRSDAQPTADQQNNNKSDVELTRQIRRAVVHDKSLSTNAHNVKIIVQQGEVTLKGPVKSEAEKMEIEKKAVEVAGSADKIHDEIEVMGDNMGGKPSPNSYEQK